MTETDIGPDEAHRVAVAGYLLRLRRLGITDRRIVSAIEAIPRSVFVPPEERDDAYAERALPIDCGQTIAAPEIVGIMTVALDAQPQDRVLEIGTGSGYQAAILARLARRVYTMDRYRTLTEAAERRFRTLKLLNIAVGQGDGFLGWPEQAPFERIVVGAAAEAVPPALVDQLVPGGVLVMPIGPADGVQKLMRFVRSEAGLDGTELRPVRFVSLIPGRAERL